MLKKPSILIALTIAFTGLAQDPNRLSIPTNATLEGIPNIPKDFLVVGDPTSNQKISLTSCFCNILAGLEPLALSPYNGVTGAQAWSTLDHKDTKVALKPKRQKGIIPVKTALWGMVLCAQELWVLKVRTEYSCTLNQGEVRSTWTNWGSIDFTSTPFKATAKPDSTSFKPRDIDHVGRRATPSLDEGQLSQPALTPALTPTLSDLNPIDIKTTLLNVKSQEFIPPNFLFGFFTEVILASAATSDRDGGIAYDKYESPIAEGYGLKITYGSAVLGQTAAYELVVRALVNLPGLMMAERKLNTCEFVVQMKGKDRLKGKIEFLD